MRLAVKYGQHPLWALALSGTEKELLLAYEVAEADIAEQDRRWKQWHTARAAGRRQDG